MEFKEREKGFALMSWEQDPNKRNINNTVKFNINRDESVTVGDIIIGDNNKGHKSQYLITEVIEERPSSIQGKKHVTVKTKWSLVNFSN